MDLSPAISYIHVMSRSKADAKATTRQLGGIRGFLRNPGLFLLTLRRGAHVGRDARGNEYYERPSRGVMTRSRRWVVYAGPADPSSIGPDWHAWLHHTTDAPISDSAHKPWQLPPAPNRTGTPLSYRPAGHEYEGGKRAVASADYEAWSPDQTP